LKQNSKKTKKSRPIYNCNKHQTKIEPGIPIKVESKVGFGVRTKDQNKLRQKSKGNNKFEQNARTKQNASL
jgi:hypothetical protein